MTTKNSISTHPTELGSLVPHLSTDINPIAKRNHYKAIHNVTNITTRKTVLRDVEHFVYLFDNGCGLRTKNELA